MTKKYHVDNVTIEDVLSWIRQGKIGLPECNALSFGQLQRLEI